MAEYLTQFIQNMPDETSGDKTGKKNIASFVQIDQILIDTLKKIDEINRLRLQAAKLS